MLTIYNWTQISLETRKKLIKRPALEQNTDLQMKVAEIIQTVKTSGDKACKAFSKTFDGVDVQNFLVTVDELNQAFKQIDKKSLPALEHALANIQKFHQAQLPLDIKVNIAPGIHCERQFRPIEKVGLYVPGGNAPLISTALMLGVPSQIAKCPTRVLCTPPDKQGYINPYLLVAAQICGIETVYKVGGAQAIAAMAYGTESIPKVDKIFGPGNAWVTEAKLQVSQDIAGASYDLPAGPSEVLVIADETANAEFIAADLLSQAEHGNDSQSILICTSESLAKEVVKAVDYYRAKLSRSAILSESLQHASIIVIEKLVDAFTISNEYAPEHLILQIENPQKYLAQITAAGSVFIGAFSPEAAGDYASGTNHVLPTSGYAKRLSGLCVNDFLKQITFQQISPEGLASLAPTISVLTDIEGLDAHQLAIDVRMQRHKQ